MTVLPSRTLVKCGLLVVLGLVMTENLGAQKLLDSIVTYSYPSDRDSVNCVKIANEYNGIGQLTSYSIYTWDFNKKHWDGGSFQCEECSSIPGRYEYGYDDKGNQVFTTTYSWWDHKIGWVEMARSKREDIYDDWGNNIFIIYNGWDSLQKDWVPYSGYEFGYDDFGRITSRITYFRSQPPEDFLPMEKILHTFDGKGRKTMQLRQVWNVSARDWVNQGKTEWLYDSLGITTEYASFYWTLTGNKYDWKEDQRHRVVKEFDLAGNLILTTELLKVSNTRWTPTRKEERAYDSSGNRVLLIISEGVGALTERSRTEWKYDTEGRLVEETETGPLYRWPGPLPLKEQLRAIRSFDNEGNKVRVIWYDWDFQTKSYLFSSKDYYFYHPASTGKQEILIESIRMYPNPTGGILNFSGLSRPAEVKIYSLQGMLLRSVQQVVNSIDLSDLSPGGYLILVSGVGQPPFRKIIIKE